MSIYGLMKGGVQHRIGYMAGWTVSHWADVMLFGFSSGRSNANGQQILTETIYLYRALVAGRTKQ